LEKQVAQLQILQWNELAATNHVRWEVWNRISSCRTPKSVGAGCSQLDPVLHAFHGQNVPDPISHRISREGSWRAYPGKDGDSWQVTVEFTDETGRQYGPFSWYTWSSNGLIWSEAFYKSLYPESTGPGQQPLLTEGAGLN
jgi:hypothetical protein